MIVNDIYSTMGGVAKFSPVLALWMRFWVRQNFRNLIATIDVNVISNMPHLPISALRPWPLTIEIVKYVFLKV